MVSTHCCTMVFLCLFIFRGPRLVVWGISENSLQTVSYRIFWTKNHNFVTREQRAPRTNEGSRESPSGGSGGRSLPACDSCIFCVQKTPAASGRLVFITFPFLQKQINKSNRIQHKQLGLNTSSTTSAEKEREDMDHEGGTCSARSVYTSVIKFLLDCFWIYSI